MQVIQWTQSRLQYAFASQARLHGYDPGEAIIEMFPLHGEFTLRESDILDTIAKEGSSIALVIFSGVQYYTGQWFPIQAITNAAHAQVSLRTHLHAFTYTTLLPRSIISLEFWSLPLMFHEVDLKANTFHSRAVSAAGTSRMQLVMFR